MSKESKKRGRLKADWVAMRDLAEKRTALLKGLSEGLVKAAVDFINGDGHSLYPMATLTDECGWPRDAAEACCREYQSCKNDPKGMLFDRQGNVIPKLMGWHSLDLLQALAQAYGVQYEGALGRGFQARLIDAAIRKHFNWESAHVCVDNL